MGDAPRLPRRRQGPPRRLARLPQELPDDDVRLLRDASRRPRGARMQGADPAPRRGRARAGGLLDGEPARGQGSRRRHGSVLAEDARDEALAAAGLQRAAGRQGVRRLPRRRGGHPQGVALHQLRLLSLRVQLARVGPGLLRPRRAREGDALRRRRARPGGGRAARGLQLRARRLGLHPLLLLQRALPERRRPARRDRQARRRVGAAGHRPRHGGEACELVRPLVGDDRLAARDRARAEDAGRRLLDQADEVRDGPRPPRQGAAAVPAARRGGRRRGAQPAQARARAGPARRARSRPGRAGAGARRLGARDRRVARGDLRQAGRRAAAPLPETQTEKEEA